MHVDDLAVSVDGPVHVAPHAGNLHVGLVDEPASPDGMTAGPRGVDQQGCEPLHPAMQRDVIHHLDAAFGEEFLQVPEGQPEPQIPAHRQEITSAGNRNPTNAEDN